MQFCIIKYIYINNIFMINASLLQKLKYKIPSLTFPVERIPPVFHKMRLAVYGIENAY